MANSTLAYQIVAASIHAHRRRQNRIAIVLSANSRQRPPIPKRRRAQRTHTGDGRSLGRLLDAGGGHHHFFLSSNLSHFQFSPSVTQPSFSPPGSVSSHRFCPLVDLGTRRRKRSSRRLAVYLSQVEVEPSFSFGPGTRLNTISSDDCTNMLDRFISAPFSSAQTTLNNSLGSTILLPA